MSNSSLATYINRMTANMNTRAGVISKLMIHTSRTVGTCKDLSMLLGSTESSSFHYGIDVDGTIGLYVDESFRAWGCGDVATDEITVHIMLMNSSTSSSYPVSDATYSSLIALCEDICRRNFIKEVIYTGTKTGNLICHSMYKSIDCPGSYLTSRMASIAVAISERLKMPLLAENEAAQSAAMSMINVDAINPYIATLDDSLTTFDCDSLRNARCVGVLINCGCYFDKLHMLSPKAEGQNTRAQVKTAVQGGMPFALSWTVRARTVPEAESECKQLYYIVSKYPPKLGMWLRLDMSTSAAISNTIIDAYYNNLVKWGLKNKCGIIADYSQLSRFTWSKFSDRFSLWLVDHLDSVANLNQVLTPQLFQVR